MSTHSILRQVVCDNGRALHFRRIGKGPPVVLLHESPRSSLALLPLAVRLAEEFTVFAFDTPGYGVSDALVIDRPSIDDFADAIARSLRLAGLTRFPVYGTHTGATIAAAMGVRHSDLVAGVVLDGCPVFTQHERDLHEAFYLPSFSPRWDGSHILSLWSRVRDQFDYFPWYLRGKSTRQNHARPSLEKHRAVFHDFLRSGAFYSAAYSASFRFDPIATLTALEIPYQVTARSNDILCNHLDRLPDLADGCAAGISSSDPDRWAANISRLLKKTPGQTVAPATLDLVTSRPGGSLGIIKGQLLVRCYGDVNGQDPLILLHDTPGSAGLVVNAAQRHAQDRLVITPELPGHGVSDPFAKGSEPVQRVGELLKHCISQFGSINAEISGWGFGDAVAKLIAAKNDCFRYTAREAERSPEPLSSAETELPPRWDGADLVASWFAIRDLEISETDQCKHGELVAGADVGRMHIRFVAQCLAEGMDREFLEAAGIN